MGSQRDETAPVEAAPAWSDSRRLGSDPHDFAGLYIRSWSKLTAVARRHCPPESDVEEIVQEAFLRMFLSLPELEHEEQLLAYARRTVINISIDRQRAKGRRPLMVSLDAVPVEHLGALEDDDTVVAAEDAAIVRDALARLSPLHRSALVMREIEEKDLAQIGLELGIADEQVKHLLYRARRALRRLLTGTLVDPATGDDVEGHGVGLAAVGRRGLAALILVVLAAAGGVTAQRAFTGHPSSASATGPIQTPVVSGPSGPSGPFGPSAAVPGSGPGSVVVPSRGSSPVSPASPAPVTSPSLAASAPAAPAPSSTGVTTTPSVGISLTPVRVIPPVRRRAPPAPVTLAPAYTLKGLVTATGPVTVTSEPTIADGDATRANSTLLAPVTAGVVALAQSVTQLPDGTTYVQIAPTVTQNGLSTAVAPAQTQASLTRTSAGVELDVTVVTATQVAVSTGPSSSVAVDGLVVELDLTPDLASVTAEHLMLQVAEPDEASPDATPPAGPTPSVSPTAATPQVTEARRPRTAREGGWAQ